MDRQSGQFGFEKVILLLSMVSPVTAGASELLVVGRFCRERSPKKSVVLCHSTTNNSEFFRFHASGANVSFADGSVRFLQTRLICALGHAGNPRRCGCRRAVFG